MCEPDYIAEWGAPTDKFEHVSQTACIRDKFAMAALTGMLAQGSWCAIEGNSVKITCCAAYESADAMMEARKK